MQLTWLAPLLVFGLVVFVHELGHFLAAKWAGVYAPRFSIGFGPTLWRKRWGETEYRLSVLPLGGYVNMASDFDEAANALEGGGVATEAANRQAAGKDWDPDAMMPFGPRPVPANRRFESKSLFQRIVIMMAGVTMNALLALAVTIGMFAAYGRPSAPAVIKGVLPDRPAAAAGLRAGDSIATVAGTPVAGWSEVLDRVGASAGKPVALGVVRGGAPVTITVTPEPREEPDPETGATRTVGRIGAERVDRVTREPIGFGEAVREGAATTWRMGTSVVKVVGGLVTGQVSVKNLGGPIAIAQTSVAAAKSGLETLWGLVAFLSINLAVLNLLPIPILDGGQILIQLAEAAKGGRFSLRTRENIMKAGLAMILALFALVMWNDVKRLLGLG